jgi:hypothetical protein
LIKCEIKCKSGESEIAEVFSMKIFNSIYQIKIGLFFLFLMMNFARNSIAANYYFDNVVDEQNGNRKRWDIEEDAKLVSLINEHGTKWRTISTQIPERNSRQCRERWHNYLAPGIKKEKLSQEEVKKVYKLQKILGHQWTAIAKQLPGRTASQIKNYWYAENRKLHREHHRSEMKSALTKNEICEDLVNACQIREQEQRKVSFCALVTVAEFYWQMEKEPIEQQILSSL